MKILTVRQPYASSMFLPVGAKDIENRTYRTSFRGRIGIHAALAWHDSHPVETQAPYLPRGVILGTVEIIGCHEAGTDGCIDADCHENYFAQQPEGLQRLWHWELSTPFEFVTPIKAVGHLGLWDALESDEYLMRIADVVMRWHAPI